MIAVSSDIRAAWCGAICQLISHDDAVWVSSRAILCSRNDMVDHVMNDRVLGVSRRHCDVLECRTLLPYSVQKTVVSELPVLALFDVQT